jgi:hypothetical protein
MTTSVRRNDSDVKLLRDRFETASELNCMARSQPMYLDDFVHRYGSRHGASKAYVDCRRGVLPDSLRSAGFRSSLKHMLYSIVGAHRSVSMGTLSSSGLFG